MSIEALDQIIKSRKETQKTVDLNKKATESLPELFSLLTKFINSYPNHKEHTLSTITIDKEAIFLYRGEYINAVARLEFFVGNSQIEINLSLEGKRFFSVERIRSDGGEEVIRANWGPYEKHDPQKVLDSYEIANILLGQN